MERQATRWSPDERLGRQTLELGMRLNFVFVPLSLGTH